MALGSSFDFIEELRCCEDSGEQHAGSVFVVEFCGPQLFVEIAKCVCFGVGEWAAPGFVGKLEDVIEMEGFGGNELLAEFFGAGHDAFSHRGEGAGVGILGGELPELFVGIDEGKGGATDAVQVIPELVELPGLLLIKNQPAELVIFAVVECECDDFVDGNDAGIAESGGEEFAKGAEISDDVAVGFAVLNGEDW